MPPIIWRRSILKVPELERQPDLSSGHVLTGDKCIIAQEGWDHAEGDSALDQSSLGVSFWTDAEEESDSQGVLGSNSGCA